MDFWKVMLESISENVMIFIALALTLLSLISSIYWGHAVSKHFNKTDGNGLQRSTYYWLDISYTVFIATISMFPLFGMLGTVIALIELGGVFQMNGADMDAIKPEFFLALTSTAWGIIFSLIFKFINSIIQPFIENQIEKAKKSLKI